MPIFKRRKETQMSDDAQCRVKDLKLSVKVDLETNEDFSGKSVAKIEIAKTINVTTDSTEREIMTAVEDVLASAFEDTQESVSESRHLSRGYHADKKKEGGEL